MFLQDKEFQGSPEKYNLKARLGAHLLEGGSKKTRPC